RAAGARGAGGICKFMPIVSPTLPVSAAAALVPEAVRPRPESTSKVTMAPPVAIRPRERGRVESMRILPFRSSMVWR
nr:hypothetical protein [Tanacetum cinerariifolium]